MLIRKFDIDPIHVDENSVIQESYNHDNSNHRTLTTK